MSGSCSRALPVGPRQRPAPFFLEVYEELTKSSRAPYSACVHYSSSAALTMVDGLKEKGYTKLPPLEEALAVHLCPPAARGWKTKAAYPTKPCRATSALVAERIP